jgi:hypothetical protein
MTNKLANKPKTGNRQLSRREFARGGALAAASAACLPAALLPAASAQSPVGAPPQPPAQSSAQVPPHEPALSTASQTEVDLKVEAVLRQYGNLLSDAEKLDVRRLMTEGQKPLDDMRAFPLDNADQPGNVLRLYPDAAASVPNALPKVQKIATDGKE